MRWQKRARLAIAAFGIVFAAVVFFAIRGREAAVVPVAVARVDPKAILETSGCELQRLTGTRKDYIVKCDKYLGYENETAKLIGVRIEVKERAGRDFLITGEEALANSKAREINLSGNVALLASDGFELTTGAATFNENDGIVRTPGAVAFKKGGMTGSGVGMTYDKNTDVLTILDQAQVRMVDGDGVMTGAFAAGQATLDRIQNFLALQRAVHAVREEQTIDADAATARLSENEEAITAIELRGNARVAGGSSAFDAMTARDIDLGYADDGVTIQRVALTGAGAITLKGTGAAPGRQIMGESLALDLAPDGAVTSVIGRDRTQLNLPAADGAPARHIRARDLDATGEAGKGMTAARFTADVEYREEAHAAATPRTARAQALAVALDGNSVTSAVFTGQVQFEDAGLNASAAGAWYEPVKGVLRLKGADRGGGPRVADEQITIEAETIDVTLEGRKMAADGTVKTRLHSSERTPGLLDRSQPTNISAAALRYDGAAGLAAYRGTAQLWQGDTAIRGASITIDQEKGNLNATGGAQSTLAFGARPSVGRAEEISYDNAKREVTFAAAAPAAPPSPAPSMAAPSTRTPAEGTAPSPVTPPDATPQSSAPTPGPPALAQLSGPEGDLRARRIVVVLRKEAGRMERLEGYDDVTLRVDQRVVRGARMTYYENGRYQMDGTPAVPVTIDEGCRRTTGRTLTFFKSTDNIVIDGNEEIRTRTTGGGPCSREQQEGGRR